MELKVPRLSSHAGLSGGPPTSRSPPGVSSLGLSSHAGLSGGPPASRSPPGVSSLGRSSHAGLSGGPPASRSPPRVSSLEQERLLSPRKFQGVRSPGQEMGAETNIYFQLFNNPSPIPTCPGLWPWTPHSKMIHNSQDPAML